MKTTKPRLYSKRVPRLPTPSYRVKKSDKGFALRTIQNTDARFGIVKELHRRIARLIEETGSVTLSKEWLCARAVFLVSRLESLEYDAVTDKQISWREYCQATKCLSDVLKRLGRD